MAVEKINPTKCRMWHLHERLGEDLNTRTCATLLSSLSIHGQKQPVLGRRVSDCDGYEIELIYGARRLFAARHLDIPLTVDVQNLDDRTAAVEMEIENRVRADISPYERGLSYRRWLNAGLFRNQGDLAKALGVSEAQVSRLLRFAELPAAVVSAFRSGSAIREDWAVSLAKRCQDSGAREGVIQRARERARSANVDPPQVVFDALMFDKARAPVRANSRDEVISDSSGTPLFRVAFRARTVHLIFPRQRITKSLVTQITGQLREAMEGESAQPGARDEKTHKAAGLVPMHTQRQPAGP
jgi:ParB/RepB/Spo0J family partition protein